MIKFILNFETLFLIFQSYVILKVMISQVAHNGRRSFLHQSRIFHGTWYLRSWNGYLGRRELRTVIQSEQDPDHCTRFIFLVHSDMQKEHLQFVIFFLFHESLMITFFLQNSFSVVLSYNWLPIKTIYYNMTVWLDFLFHFEGLDVWWYLRNHSVLSCRSHLQEEKSIQVEDWCQCCQEKLNPTGRSLDGRIQELLL